MEFALVAAFGLYFCLLIIIGLVASRRSALAHPKPQGKSSSFIVGGRSLNFWVTALSAHASDMSDWLFMAFPALIFTQGLPQAWVAIGLVIFMFLNWHFIAPRLRQATGEWDAPTLAAFFERRYGDTAGVIRLVSALASLLFFTIYISAGLYGVGLLFESLFGLNYHLGILIGIAVMVFYTTVGGFVVVAWIDCFQAMFLLSMIVLVPCLAFTKLTGSVASVALQKNIALSLLPELSFASIGNAILLMFGWGLGYFGMPHILNKFMGIADGSQLYKAKYVGITWQIIILCAAVAVGLVGIAYFPGGLAVKELIFVEMTRSLFTPFFAGLVLCGVLAATISTIDSQILVLAGVLTEDCYKHMLRKTASARELRTVFRISIVAIGCVAAAIALAKISSIYTLVWYSWSGLGCSFGPLVILSLYSKRANKYGAVAGIVTGMVVAALWPLLNPLLFSLALPNMIVGFFSSLIMILLVSRVTE